MKIYALIESPMPNSFIKEIDKLGDYIEIVGDTPFEEISGLTDSEDEKILIISPLFKNWSMPNSELDKVNNIKAICLTSTSYSWIDVDYLASKNIPVMNGGSYSTNAVAEGALMMALNISRRMPQIAYNNWSVDFKKHEGIELFGRTAGVIGLGNIGRRIAELMKGIGMKTTYWSKNSRDERFELVDLTNLFSESDVIFVALAENEESKALISDEMLNSMRQDTIFISIAHKVYNYDLVHKLAEEKKIFGFANEEKDYNMLESDSNIMTGFASVWFTNESIERNNAVILNAVKNVANDKFPDRIN